MGRIQPIPRPVLNKKRGCVVRGNVVDEVVVSERYPGNEDFEDCVQLIEWEDGGRTVRFCYYVRSHGAGDDAWTFANRPLSIGTEELKKLLVKASKKDWFRPALP